MNSPIIAFAKGGTLRALIKQAVKAGYTIAKEYDFFVSAKDSDKLVFKATQVRKGIWQINYSPDYWKRDLPECST